MALPGIEERGFGENIGDFKHSYHVQNFYFHPGPGGVEERQNFKIESQHPQILNFVMLITFMHI